MTATSKLFIGILVFLGWASFARQHFVCQLRGACEASRTVTTASNNPKTTGNSNHATNTSGTEGTPKEDTSQATTDVTNARDTIPITTDTSNTGAITPPKEVAQPTETLFNKTFSGLKFENNASAFQPTASFLTYTDKLGKFLAKNPDHKIVVTGHTDSDGEEAANYQLGLRRAKSVAQYFTSQGIKAVIETASQGEKNPIASNNTPEGKRSNRRVNIQITKK